MVVPIPHDRSVSRVAPSKFCLTTDQRLNACSNSLRLAQALRFFVKHPTVYDTELAGKLLNNTELQVLSDIREFLRVPYTIQETLVAEYTPTLSLMFPAYETSISLLKAVKRKKPLLTHAVDASIGKLEEYLGKMRRN